MPRDASGNVTLPTGNPVISDTDITTAWCNPTMADLAAEMQDSLSRSGKGGMLVPFKNMDGTVTNPGITFTNQTGTGWSRSAAGVALSIAGAAIARFTATALDLLTGRLNLKATGATSNRVVSAVADGATAIALTIDTDNALGSAGAKLLSIKNAGTEKFAIDKDGNIVTGLPTPNYELSALSTGNFFTTNAAWTDVTNAVVTGFVATGRPIEIYIVDDATGNEFQLGASNSAALLSGVYFQVLRDAVAVSNTALPCPKNDGAANGSASFPPGTMFALDIPAAGTYTYKLQTKALAATDTSFVKNAKLYVKEI